MNKVLAATYNPALFNNWATDELIAWVERSKVLKAEAEAAGMTSFRGLAIANAEAELATRGVNA